ncbi:MAG TPA: sugar phosphate isomerase/epimerase family protein [Armatimonadota bacterium]|nr:sugar phosphate isomerase/epimerase family protein [Armatimonadota bacterium]
MKIAIIPTTGGADPWRGIEVAVELGVEGVHIGGYGGPWDLEHRTPSERRGILERIRSYGLEVSALIGWGGNVDLCEEENWEENIAWGQRLNETAVDMSGGLWMAHAGICPEDESSPRYMRFREGLKRIADHGERVGAIMALETGPEPPRVVRKLMEDIGSPALRVNFDPANLLLWPPHIAKEHGVPFDYQWAMDNFDPVEGLRTLIPFVAHSHAKDSVLRPDGTCEEVPLGTGMTNWPELHRVFVENGYRGFYAIERECGEDAMGDVRKAVEYLKGLD